MIPQINCHGTITRRTVDPLLATMTEAKPHKTGSEPKSRIQAPYGYRLVGADFDSQEMQIASMYADVATGQGIGSTPMSQAILHGSKGESTDAHSVVAREAGISRDVAKIVNFSILLQSSHGSMPS